MNWEIEKCTLVVIVVIIYKRVCIVYGRKKRAGRARWEEDVTTGGSVTGGNERGGQNVLPSQQPPSRSRHTVTA